MKLSQLANLQGNQETQITLFLLHVICPLQLQFAVILSPGATLLLTLPRSLLFLEALGHKDFFLSSTQVLCPSIERILNLTKHEFRGILIKIYPKLLSVKCSHLALKDLILVGFFPQEYQRFIMCSSLYVC